MSFLHQARLAIRAVLGVDVERYSPRTAAFPRLANLLDQQDLGLVLDVGANTGGFGQELMRAGYTGAILSFEPLPDARSELVKAARAWKDRWNVAPEMALSDREGTAKFNVSNNSVSSSLLAMKAAHVSAAPNSAMVRQITVPTRRLDNYWPLIGVASGAFLKLDVQGAENLVLDGAGQLLEGAIKGLQLELSVAPLYDGQALANELDARVRGYGFELWDLIPGFRHPSTLQILQYDAVYFRRK
jgi:FkbM family methyltransferase